MIDDLARWAPTLVAALGAAVVWGRNSSALEALRADLTAHRDESRARDEERAKEQRAIAAEVTAARETLARGEERHGALSGRVERLEGVDSRHDTEIVGLDSGGTLNRACFGQVSCANDGTALTS